MSQDAPLTIILLTGLTGYVFSLWLADYRSLRAGHPLSRGAFPGVAPTSAKMVAVAVLGAWALLALETGGEYALGVSEQQKNITVLYLAAMVSAAFGEELIFRGFLVVPGCGRGVLMGSIVGFSLLFALFHPFLWEWKSPAAGGLTFDFSLKAWWSTALVFICSLWFYSMRFNPWNARRSLIPCFAAHLAKNLGVFAIKLAQGHVHGWW